jgi:hypothetical protein
VRFGISNDLSYNALPQLTGLSNTKCCCETSRIKPLAGINSVQHWPGYALKPRFDGFAIGRLNLNSVSGKAHQVITHTCNR